MLIKLANYTCLKRESIASLNNKTAYIDYNCSDLHQHIVNIINWKSLHTCTVFRSQNQVSCKCKPTSKILFHFTFCLLYLLEDWGDEAHWDRKKKLITPMLTWRHELHFIKTTTVWALHGGSSLSEYGDKKPACSCLLVSRCVSQVKARRLIGQPGRERPWFYTHSRSMAATLQDCFAKTWTCTLLASLAPSLSYTQSDTHAGDLAKL